MGCFAEDFDGCLIVFVWQKLNQKRTWEYCLFELTFDFSQVWCCSELDNGGWGRYFIEFFSHEHVLLGNESVDFNAVGFILLFQLTS